MAQETVDSRVPGGEANVRTVEADAYVDEADTHVGTDESSNTPGAALVRGLVPFYHQVYSTLRREIDAGRRKPGGRLPMERGLRKFYGCSLVTMRRALDELVREGQIYRIRGRGTFVSESPVERQFAELTSFTTETTVHGLESRTVVLTQGVTEPTPSTADWLGTASGLPAYLIKRLRIAGNEPLLLGHVFLPEYLFPGLLSLNLGSSSLYTRLFQRFDIDLVNGHQTIQPALPSAREAALLRQERSEPALLIRLISCSVDECPIEYCRTVVKGSRTKYHISVARPWSVWKGNFAPRPRRHPRTVDTALEQVSRA